MEQSRERQPSSNRVNHSISCIHEPKLTGWKIGLLNTTRKGLVVIMVVFVTATTVEE